MSPLATARQFVTMAGALTSIDGFSGGQWRPQLGTMQAMQQPRGLHLSGAYNCSKSDIATTTATIKSQWGNTAVDINANGRMDEKTDEQRDNGDVPIRAQSVTSSSSHSKVSIETTMDIEQMMWT
eukprot:2633531-Amphidinium_carterae.6